MLSACQTSAYVQPGMPGDASVKLVARNDDTMKAEGRSLSFETVDGEKVHGKYDAVGPKELHLMPGRHVLVAYYTHKELSMTYKFSVDLTSGSYVLRETGAGKGPDYWLVKDGDSHPIHLTMGRD